jgi:sphingolipid delta-4 desaturase
MSFFLPSAILSVPGGSAAYLTTEGEQETFSYYGFLNAVTFNVGYHNEHHDFPSVPWNRLPKIKAIAPEFYVELKSHMSWTRLFFQFLFDRELSLFSRMVREDRNRVALSDEVRPDLDVIEGRGARGKAPGLVGKHWAHPDRRRIRPTD